MKLKVLALALPFALVACGGGETENTDASDVNADTTVAVSDEPDQSPQTGDDPIVTSDVIVIPEVIDDVSQIYGKFIDGERLPFNPGLWDGEWEAMEEMNELYGAEVEFLTQNMHDIEFNERASWDVEGFYRMDSIVNNGLYDDYLESIDIGMTERSTARALYRFDLDEARTVLTWFIDYKTIDACPFAAGNLCFATVVTDGEVTSCTLLNENMAGGDPPSWGDRTISGLLNQDGSIALHHVEREGYEDEEGNEEIYGDSSDYMMMISPEGLIVLQN